MQFEVEKRENYTLVRVLAEKLDANNSTDLKSQLVFISGQGEKNIVLDLSQCKYCDSSGLRAFLVANRLCEEAIGACIISGLQPDVENIFRISMLHTVLLITKTVEEAEDLLKKKETLKSDVKNNDI
jgi:anti-sigma B factor antagonist